MTSNNKRIAKNTIILYIRMIFVLFLQFYVSRRLLAELGVEDYGIYNVVAGFVSVFAFLTTSLSNGYQRFFNIALGKKDFEQYSKILSNALIIQLVAVGILSLILETVGLWILNTKLNIPEGRMFAANMVFQGAIITMAVSMLRAPFQAVVISNERMNFFAVVSVLEVLLILGIVILLSVQSSDSLILYSFLYPIVVISTTLVYVIYTLRSFKYIKFKAVIDKGNIKELAFFSGWNLFGSLAHMLKSQGVNIVLNLFFGVTVNAARGIASQVQTGLSNLYTNFQLASRPQAIQSYSIGDVKRMVDLSNNVARFSFMLLWLFSLPVMWCIEWILSFWLGDNVPSESALFSILSIIIALVESFANPISTMVHATGRMRNFQVLTSSCILLIVPLSYIVLSLGSPPEGAMYASIIVLCLAHVVRLVLVKKLIDFSIRDYFLRTIMPSVLVVIVSIILSYLLANTFIAENVVLFALVVLIVNIITICIFGISGSERLLMLKYIQKLNSKSPK